MARVMNPNPNNVNPPSMVRINQDPRNPIVYEQPLQREWGRDPGWIQPPDTTGNKNYRPIHLGGTVADPGEGSFPTAIPLDDIIDRQSSKWEINKIKQAPPLGVNHSVLFNYKPVPMADYREFPDDTTKKIPLEVNKQPPDPHDSIANYRGFKWQTIVTEGRPWSVPESYKPDRRELSDSRKFFNQPTPKGTEFRVSMFT